MCRRVTVVVLCVCLSVTTLAATYLVYTSQVRNHRVLHGFFQGFSRVAFAINTLFKSYGIICWSPPPSSLPYDLGMCHSVFDDIKSKEVPFFVEMEAWIHQDYVLPKQLNLPISRVYDRKGEYLTPL